MSFNHQINIDKNKNVSLYLQIKEAIRHLIESESLPSGTKIPTERQLSQTLGVSRNTVSMAYRELETEGYISSIRGRGTFVFYQDNKEDVFQSMIDSLFFKAISKEYNLNHLKEQFLNCYENESKKIKTFTVAFIECNYEQLNYMAQQLEHRFHIQVEPILIQDIRDKKKKTVDILKKADFIVTTTFHFDEVNAFLELLSIQKIIVTLALEFKLNTMVDVAKCNKDTKLGILCNSEAFAKNVLYLIQKINPEVQKISFSTSKDEKEIIDFCESQHIVFYSPNRGRDLKDILVLTETKEIILLPDTGSMVFLESTLSKLKS